MLIESQKETIYNLQAHWDYQGISKEDQQAFLKFLKDNKAFGKFLNAQDGTYRDVANTKSMLIASFMFPRDTYTIYYEGDDTEEHY